MNVRADDGCDLWTAEAGAGDPLILCHGGPGLWDYFDDVAGLLRGTMRVIRWDQRGCGRSQRRGPYAIDRSVADLDAVRERLAGARTAVLGHSWGAHLALRYALAHPERVSHLIYVAGTGIDAGRGWHPHYERGLRQRLGDHLERWRELRTRERTPAEEREWAILQWSADFADGATATAHAARLATPWLEINYECSRAINTEVKAELATEELAARCRTLDVPVLIVHGTEDIRPGWAVDSLHDALPDVRRVSLTGAGHLPWVERPARFVSAVTDFLRATSRDGDAGHPPRSPRH